MTKPILKAKNLSIGYRNKKNDSIIAAGISFEISSGSLVGLVGGNGIGKSTLLRTLLGMQPSLQGEISIYNKSLESHSPIVLATQVSVVLTETPASKNLTVEELVSLGRHPHTNWVGLLTEIDKTKINEALEATHLSELKNKKCFELSDGQLQRVYIARALAQDTPLILLDEPTTHLDLYHRAYILKLLQELAHTQNKTILFSTHEIDLAIQLTDYMLVMSKEKTAFDKPKNLIDKGAFDSLFPSEIITFNKETGRFSIK
ncbi:ABC transporter ATP-binding protein [Patiriisocius sp. Uisw_017]|jgi:iron complex transport system ATP-binding protein|uniref:ABC transporter ATP-binding protein n=1 Tax=Patiriisocius sp. Uisw_017 TaxID=3230968 RepID=UPI0039EB6ED9